MNATLKLFTFHNFPCITLENEYHWGSDWLSKPSISTLNAGLDKTVPKCFPIQSEERSISWIMAWTTADKSRGDYPEDLQTWLSHLLRQPPQHTRGGQVTKIRSARKQVETLGRPQRSCALKGGNHIQTWKALNDLEKDCGGLHSHNDAKTSGGSLTTQ